MPPPITTARAVVGWLLVDGGRAASSDTAAEGITRPPSHRRRRGGVAVQEPRGKALDVEAFDIPSLLEIVDAAQERTARQIASLESIVAAIVEGSELVSTDDEHDPEGATIAYERAQAGALLRQARADRDALAVTRHQLEMGRHLVCEVCGRDIDLERVAALPTTARCVTCAT